MRLIEQFPLALLNNKFCFNLLAFIYVVGSCWLVFLFDSDGKILDWPSHRMRKLSSPKQSPNPTARKTHPLADQMINLIMQPTAVNAKPRMLCEALP